MWLNTGGRNWRHDISYEYLYPFDRLEIISIELPLPGMSRLILELFETEILLSQFADDTT